MLKKIKQKAKTHSHFIFLVFLITATISVTYLYNNNKNSQNQSLKKTLSNVYLQKTFAKITSALQERYNEIEYTVEEGDNFESIINKIKLPKKEKKIFLETVKKNKEIRILRPSQKIYFKIDKKDIFKIVEFRIQINKKKEIQFVKDLDSRKFNSNVLEKELEKVITYKESKITNSLYQTAISLKIKSNII